MKKKNQTKQKWKILSNNLYFQLEVDAINQRLATFPNTEQKV